MPTASSFSNVWTGSQLLQRTAHRHSSDSPRWSCGALAGRLVELSGASSMTAAFALVLDAQVQGEPVAWVSAQGGKRESVFFAPDAIESGVDLGALPVVRVPGAHGGARAADKLLRSGAFGLIVVDLGARAHIPTPLQGRILRLAEKHRAAVVMLTEKDRHSPSLSSLVSLRAEAIRRRLGEDRFICEILAVKDKGRTPGWSIEEVYRGPMGLR